MRTRNGKLVHNHSTFVQGLRKALAVMAEWPEVKTLTPGRIDATGGGRAFVITVQRRTPSGLRCLAKAAGNVQVLYVTTADPERVEAMIEERFGKEAS